MKVSSAFVFTLGHIPSFLFLGLCLYSGGRHAGKRECRWQSVRPSLCDEQCFRCLFSWVAELGIEFWVLEIIFLQNLEGVAPLLASVQCPSYEVGPFQSPFPLKVNCFFIPSGTEYSPCPLDSGLHINCFRMGLFYHCDEH
jgi:hypothetical protein